MKNPIKPKIIGDNYLHRWHLIPRNRWFNVYLHKFIGNDDDRALHDHPWWSFSIRLHGKLVEFYLVKDKGTFKNLSDVVRRIPPRFCFRSATFAHRMELSGTKPAWTLFITGPRVRDWGFHCPKGWVHWTKMTTPDGKKIGGCDDN